MWSNTLRWPGGARGRPAHTKGIAHVDWGLLISAITGVLGMAIAVTQRQIKAAVARRERDDQVRRDQEERLQSARDAAEQARHTTTMTKLDGLGQSVGELSRRIDANQAESREEIRRLHEQDIRQIERIARLEGRLPYQSRVEASVKE